MLHEAISALAIVFDPARFAIICCGVVLGLIIGVIPRIGGLAGLALVNRVPDRHSLWIAMYLLFNTLLHVPWPPSLLGEAFSQLRSMLAGLI